MSFGLFIVFEGGEGSGKTTAIKKVFDWLLENNKNVLITREPGGIKISEDIRKVILDKKNTSMDKKTEALLYAAARRQHLVEKIIPALNSGTIVLCDRFIDSSLCYQGYARGIGIDEVNTINEFAIDGYMPNLTILFDLDPEVGLNRINSNNSREINRIDLESLDFHKKVRDGYNLLYNSNPSKYIRINADQPIDTIFNELKLILTEFIF